MADTYGEVLDKFLRDFELPSIGAEKQVSILALVIVDRVGQEENRNSPLFLSSEDAVIEQLGYSKNLALRYRMLKNAPMNEKRFLQKVQRWVTENTTLESY